MAAVVAMLRVELAPAVTLAGLRVAVTPAGAPETVRATLWALPEVTAVATVLLVAGAGGTEPAAGEALSEKSLTGVPVTPRV
ncbi:hypothetical protein GCM10009665_28040 [Kitasatospora nipponensis]|uniref:Uncharacterized protein n=1 Tax=Kitasatospora nipponensis TaxID=258049 RepID=A0ABP4GS55_9ACTN